MLEPAAARRRAATADRDARARPAPARGGRGVRRPLRFLAWKLELDDDQLGEVAKILAELKTERAQGEVDRAKRLAAFADAVSAEAFDASRAGEGAALRVASAERMRSATLKALERLHALLEPEQRQTLAYLIRTGASRSEGRRCAFGLTALPALRRASHAIGAPSASATHAAAVIASAAATSAGRTRRSSTAWRPGPTGTAMCAIAARNTGAGRPSTSARHHG